MSYSLFGLTIAILSQVSVPGTSLAAYMTLVAVNGLTAGAVVTYTPAHLLHLTDPSVHALALGLLTTARVFAGSFASAIGGGLFSRVLKSRLEQGFEKAGLEPNPELVEKLLGSPAMVQRLLGKEKEVAVQGYVDSLEVGFLLVAALTFAMTILQACTGWKGFKEKAAAYDRVDGEENEL